MRLPPDPVLIFVTLSWLYLVHLMQCKWAFLSLSVKWYICLSRDSNTLSHDPEVLSWIKHVDQTSSSGLYDEKDQYNEHIPYVVIVVRSGLTSLSTIFQTYHDGVWLRQGAQCSLKYHAQDIWHDTTPSHIILTLPRPVLALPRLSAKQGAASTIFKDFGMSRPGIEPVTSSFRERTLYRQSYRGRCTPCVQI